jgi:hypothetical protein
MAKFYFDSISIPCGAHYSRLRRLGIARPDRFIETAHRRFGVSAGAGWISAFIHDLEAMGSGGRNVCGLARWAEKRPTSVYFTSDTTDALVIEAEVVALSDRGDTAGWGALWRSLHAGRGKRRKKGATR